MSKLTETLLEVVQGIEQTEQQLKQREGDYSKLKEQILDLWESKDESNLTLEKLWRKIERLVEPIILDDKYREVFRMIEKEDGAGATPITITFNGSKYPFESVAEAVSEDGFNSMRDSCGYRDTGGGWRDTYRRLFVPAVYDFLKGNQSVSSDAEAPYFSIEQIVAD